LIVRDDQGHGVPYLGSPAQVGVQPITIASHQDVAMKPFDLAQWYYLRRPGKYTVSWPGERPLNFPGEIPNASLAATPDFQFEVAPNPAAAADGDPVGLLLPLVKKDWYFWAPLMDTGKLHPGGNRQEVVGRVFTFEYPSTNEKGPRIWLWLTDQPAAEQPNVAEEPPPSEYIGKVSRWYVYFYRSASGVKAWPTAKQDITRALSREVPATRAAAQPDLVAPVAAAVSSFQTVLYPHYHAQQ